KEEVLSTFVRLLRQASLDPAELEDLIAHAKERTGRGVRAIAKMLKHAQAEQAAEQKKAERNRRAAERKDPRPQLPSPKPDAPWLPQMAAYNDVVGNATDDVPPARDISGDASKIQRIEIAGTHAFISEGEMAP